jgi:A/G-specific adenine glycosylase
MGEAPSNPLQRRQARTALIRWYSRESRPLPWRATRDPYGIWISEVMLQQTTVAVVMSRWKRFLSRFPTVARLAAASQQEVLAEWSGLGYYARARNLHSAARQIVAGAHFPGSFAELRSLPGFGPYTAAAVASIAFGERVAAIDTNSRRVLSRLLGCDTAATVSERGRIEAFGNLLLPRTGTGDHNQALMELGALVCGPRAPRCPACPLERFCLAASAGPVCNPFQAVASTRRSRPRRIRLAVGLARRHEKIVLVEDHEMVPGHLTLPGIRVADAQDAGSGLGAAWATLAGRNALALRPLGRLRHAVLKRLYEVDLFAVEESERGLPCPARLTLVREEQLPGIVRGSFLDKAVALARKGKRLKNGT